MHRAVAIRARHVARLMRAPLPQGARRLLVTAEADRVSLRYRRLRLLPDGPALAERFPARFRVLFAGTVAAFATELLGVEPRVSREDAPHGRLLEDRRFFLVADEARLPARVFRPG